MWPFLFADFYRDFPARVSSAYDRLPASLKKFPAKLGVWKTLGDEMLFTSLVCDRFEMLAHTMAFKTAVNEFNHDWRDKPLQLKPTAWLAGFPVQNTELIIPGGNGSGNQADFIGPSIDAGFRLTKFASDRQFVVSAEAALLVLAAAEELGQTTSIHLFYEGKHLLKGVDRDRPYPIVWVDLLDNQPDPERSLMGLVHRNPCDASTLTQTLNSHISHRASTLIRPFIENDQKFGHLPLEVIERREKMIEVQATYRDGLEKNLSESTGNPIPLSTPEVQPSARKRKKAKSLRKKRVNR